MAILYRSLTIARLWALIEGHPPLISKFGPARRVADTRTGHLRRLILRSVGDFPFLQIEMGDNFGGTGIPITDLDSERGDFGRAVGDEWDESCTADFKLSIVYEMAGFDREDELEMLLMEAIRSGGRDLGYTPIRRWGMWRGRRDGTTNVNETRRPVTQIVIPVTYEFKGSTLLPA